MKRKPKGMEEDFFKWIISYSEVNEFIKDTKLSFLNYKAFVNANILYKEVENRNDVKFEFSQIKNWTLFQRDIEDLSQEHFYNYFLKDMSPNELVLLFTDEGGFNKCAFKFHVDDFYKFSDSYEDFFEMRFFQLSYYLLVYPQLNIVKCLDDDGGIHKYIFQGKKLEM
jgi:hypothetical protein